ncbi:MAG: 2-methylcitrate dehydratase, partial [Xanthomonadales bacterium]|nr:2-methylcitrate dehydratase [Xanthomonadales bacterium]
ITGELTAESYADDIANDPRIDSLRDLMEVTENEKFTVDYFDPGKRGIGNAIQVFFNDGSSTERVEISYPIGHKRRREEGIPVLITKFEKAVTDHFSAQQADAICASVDSQANLKEMSVPAFVDGWVL